jgi:hypothetical protein
MIPSLSLIGCGLVFLTGRNPIRRLANGLVRIAAAGYLAREMAQGAWLRKSRWSECLDRARREI